VDFCAERQRPLVLNEGPSAVQGIQGKQNAQRRIRPICCHPSSLGMAVEGLFRALGDHVCNQRTTRRAKLLLPAVFGRLGSRTFDGRMKCVALVERQFSSQMKKQMSNMPSWLSNKWRSQSACGFDMNSMSDYLGQCRDRSRLPTCCSDRTDASAQARIAIAHHF
jgi:hypothetical protein